MSDILFWTAVLSLLIPIMPAWNEYNGKSFICNYIEKLIALVLGCVILGAIAYAAVRLLEAVLK